MRLAGIARNHAWGDSCWSGHWRLHFQTSSVMAGLVWGTGCQGGNWLPEEKNRRYAHIAALRCDALLPELLGMKKIVSEDAIRRAFKAIDETEGAVCGARICTIALSRCWPSPRFSTSIRRSSRFTAIRKERSWATTPRSRGVRAIAITPIRWLRRVWSSMSTPVPATSTPPNTARPGLWALLDRLPRDLWPALLRGDRGFMISRVAGLRPGSARSSTIGG